MDLRMRRRALMATAQPEDLHLNSVVTLDGIQNTRSGHSSTSTKWEDLTANHHDFTLLSGASAPIWNTNHISFDATKRVLHNGSGLWGTDKSMSVELVAQVIDYGTLVDGSAKLGFLISNRPSTSNNGLSIYSYDTGGISSYWRNVSLGYTGSSGPTAQPRYICWVFDGSSCTRYVDGVAAGTSSPAAFFGSTARVVDMYIGGSELTGYCYADIYRFGIDGTAFTAAEVASRYQYFKHRFNLP